MHPREDIGKLPEDGVNGTDIGKLFRDIFVVKPSSMGDVVHTLPAVALIKRAWPEARLRWLVNPEWAPLLEGNPDIDEVVPFPRRDLAGLLKLPAQLRWLRTLRRNYASDLVLDFQCLLRSALAGRACRRADGMFLGLSDAREGARFFYDRVVSVGREHAVDRYLKIPVALGLDTSGPAIWHLPAGSPPQGLNLAEPFCLLHPFSRGAGKSLSVEDVAAFAKALRHPVVLAGRTDERIPATENVVDLLNRTSIPELIWLIRQARFVVSVDSGPMHIAAAITSRLLGIHTWSDPARVGPYEPEAWIWKDRLLTRVADMRHPSPKPATAPDAKSIAAFVREQMTAKEVSRNYQNVSE